VNAPRYLLRKYLLTRLLAYGGYQAGSFLEIGYGEAEMLLHLAGLGFSGDGFDFSPTARRAAESLLAECPASTRQRVRLIDSLAAGSRYDYIFAFEVIGYWKEPGGELARLRGSLKQDGRLVLSFTDLAARGFAERVTGDMQCFTVEQVRRILEEGGLEPEVIWNYGFPLANLLKPVLNLYHFVRHLRNLNRNSPSSAAEKSDREACREVQSGAPESDDCVKASGITGNLGLFRLARLFVNERTIRPFCIMQMAFKNSRLGTGYLVVARNKRVQA